MRETPGRSSTEIGRLREQIEGLVDADLILPEDGQWLMAMLDGALVGLTESNEPATRAGIEAFVGRIRSLIEAGVLAAGDGGPPIKIARALVAGLPGTVGTGLETQRRQGEISRG